MAIINIATAHSSLELIFCNSVLSCRVNNTECTVTVFAEYIYYYT